MTLLADNTDVARTIAAQIKATPDKVKLDIFIKEIRLYRPLI